MARLGRGGRYAAGLPCGADKDFATVDGVAIAFDEASFFEAVEDAGDGAGGQTGGAGEVSGGGGPCE